jgi:hypothetical protein
METTHTITSADIGSVLDPANGYITALRMTAPPSRYDAAVQTRDGSAWASGAFSVRGVDDVALIGGNLICIETSNPCKRFVALNIGYRGGLKICSVPVGSQWEVILSDQPIVRQKAA